ncbi:MAG: helix-turn-helix domain-containing protein [Deltaproteobacteria bacterium]|nr:helix-turn-helix domain-containing protein [Deltaproteobacteria bacterium]
MEKICIVKLRKQAPNQLGGLYPVRPGEASGENRIGNAPFLPPAETQPVPATQGSEGSADNRRDAAGPRLSLTLTQEQMRALKLDPYAASLLYEKAQGVSGKVGQRDEEMVIHLELPSLPPVRFLKLSEVAQMLRVSRGFLNRILSEGKLNSYKFGKLRRVMLDELLSYLESHQEAPGHEEPATTTKTSRRG